MLFLIEVITITLLFFSTNTQLTIQWDVTFTSSCIVIQAKFKKKRIKRFTSTQEYLNHRDIEDATF